MRRHLPSIKARILVPLIFIQESRSSILILQHSTLKFQVNNQIRPKRQENQFKKVFTKNNA